MPIKNNKEETYEKISEISKNNDYLIGNLLDYQYFSNHGKIIAIDLRKQIELEKTDLKQHINFISKVKKMMEQRCFLSLKNQKKQLLSFYKIQ